MWFEAVCSSKQLFIYYMYHWDSIYIYIYVYDIYRFAEYRAEQGRLYRPCVYIYICIYIYIYTSIHIYIYTLCPRSVFLGVTPS